MISRRGVAAAACAVVGLCTVPTADARSTPRIAPPVIAVVGESGGVNVLHEDFRLAAPARFPTGMPTPVTVTLPAKGTFAERLRQVQAGPLGHMKPGVLYWLAGTRLLAVAPHGSATSVVGGNTLGHVTIDVADPTGSDMLQHGTGVVGAAVSGRTGTAPTAWALVVAGDNGGAAWSYLSRQSWVDVATTSSFLLTAECEGVPEVRRFRAGGRVPFAAVGNTQDPQAPAAAPVGLPEFFHVGGVDEQGRTRLVPQPERANAFYAAEGPQRPYETGDLFAFPAPSSAALTGTMTFGGTSGASPRVAGRAAVLIAHARAVLSASPTRPAEVYAAAPADARLPARGPLADGLFTAGELERLLHVTAVPAEPASPARYLVEGYGATTDAAMARARAILGGTAVEVARPDDDRLHKQVEALRAQHFDARC